VDSNKPLVNYSRNFGDGQTRIVQTNEITHSYEKAGVYDVILKVTDPNGEENQVTRKVFIGEKNSPVSSFTVEDEKGTILTQTDSCEGKPAYRVERQQTFKMDIKNSVNIKGQTSKDLNVFFQPKNDDIYNRSDFTYKFTELGCSYIDLTVEDTSIGKNDRQRILFKVVNALPKINNLIMYFPQYGNQFGIGFNQNQQKDIFKLSYDPLIVRIVAQSPNPIDADGVVSYYTFYFYKKENPSRIIEAKVTPGSIPYAYFSLPT
jgi:PKD repeat protein